jgi:hypothetical protein
MMADMKRIVHGVTYNTGTSTVLARATRVEDNGERMQTLYQSFRGAFFVVDEGSKRVWNERRREWGTEEEVTFEPLSPERAHDWMLTGQVDVIKNPFDAPPEEIAEAEPGSTIYVRVPAALKRRIDKAARQAEMSVNAWVMRCLDQGLEASQSPEEREAQEQAQLEAQHRQGFERLMRNLLNIETRHNERILEIAEATLEEHPKHPIDSLDLERGERKRWFGHPERCDLCRRPFAETRFMIDAHLKKGGGAYVCAVCFAMHGTGLGAGKGQLVARQSG